MGFKADSKANANAIFLRCACALSIIVACVLTAGLPFRAEALVAGQIQAKSVLFVGNSFTKHGDFGVIPPLEALAEANDKNIDAQGIVYSMAPLSSYAALSPEMPERYQNLEQALTSKTWDCVVLQEKSMYPLTNPVEMYCSIGLLAKRIHNLQPDAEILLYMTHGFSNGKKYAVNGISRKLSASDFGAYVQACYTDVGSKYGLRVVPVGMYFNRFATCFPEAELFESDNKHPSKLGFFLASCAFYEALFGEQPNVPAATLEDVPESDQLTAISLLGVSAAIDPAGLALRVGQTAQLAASLGDSVEERDDGDAADDGADDSDARVDGVDELVVYGNGAEEFSISESDGASSPDNPGVAVDSDNLDDLDGNSDPDDLGDSDDPDDPDNPDNPDDQGKATFKSIDPDIATVNDAGVVEAVSEGVTAIVFEDASGRRAACRVSVESDELMEAKLLFAENRITLPVGSSRQVLPQVSGSLGAFSLKWFSSDEDVVVVDEFGNVKALRGGEAVIVVLDIVSTSMACYTIDAVKEKLDKPDKVKIKQKKTELNGKNVTALRVEWAPVDDAAAYQVYRCVGEGELELVKRTKKCVFVDKEPPVNCIVQYRIRAISDSGLMDSGLSAIGKGVRLSKPKLNGISKKRYIKLKWKANPAAKSYYIYRAPKGSNKYKYIARVKGSATTSWNDRSIRLGKNYKYRIRSMRTINGVQFMSGYSKTVTVKAKRK